MTITFRPLRRDDFAQLSEWLAEPHVERWWREDSSPDAVEAAYGPVVDRDDPTEVFVVRREDVLIGIIQRYLNGQDPDWLAALAPTGSPPDSAGIDYLIGDPALVGQGIGTAMIGRFVADTWSRYPDIRAVVVTVNVANRASWRALEKVGFERTWTGEIHSGDQSDEGVSYCYVLARPT
jgi:aminoglycoside 6'-N-acetyltransferase